MVLQVVQKFLQVALDIEFDPSEFVELVPWHTRSSYKLDTPPESSMGRIWVVALVTLGIQARLEALPATKEHVVSRQPLHSQVPSEVGRVLVVVVYPLFTKEN